MKIRKNLKRFRYYFSKSQADDRLSAFSKAELRFLSLFDVPARVGNSDAVSYKISRISKCFHRSKQELKKYFLNNKDAKNFFKTTGAYTENTDWIF